MLISQDLHSFVNTTCIRKNKSTPNEESVNVKRKLDVIKYKDKSGCGSRSLAEKFCIRNTQIVSILKYRDKILREFETNARKAGNEEINKLIWKWFKDMSQRKLPISGPMLQEKVLQFAKDLGNT